MFIIINSIKYNDSVADGPGIRTVLFMQGCNLHCEGCQNKSTWMLEEGIKFDVDNLVETLQDKCMNKKITISGGEPLYQLESLRYLIKKLYKLGFNITLYTGHKKDDVPKDIINNINYLKTGRFIKGLKTTTKSYVGSSNQIFEEVKHETIK